jgi:hypothetical protein
VCRERTIKTVEKSLSRGQSLVETVEESAKSFSRAFGTGAQKLKGVLY